MQDKEGPYRETAVTRLQILVEGQRRKLAGLEALLKVAEKAETGSPLEVTLWKLCFKMGTGDEEY